LFLSNLVPASRTGVFTVVQHIRRDMSHDDWNRVLSEVKQNDVSDFKKSQAGFRSNYSGNTFYTPKSRDFTQYELRVLDEERYWDGMALLFIKRVHSKQHRATIIAIITSTTSTDTTKQPALRRKRVIFL
jgi:hypothetical protein